MTMSLNDKYTMTLPFRLVNSSWTFLPTVDVLTRQRDITGFGAATGFMPSDQLANQKMGGSEESIVHKNPGLELKAPSCLS